MFELNSFDDVVESSKKYRQVLVMGPPRSGTTMISTFLAEELDWPYIGETQIIDIEDEILDTVLQENRNFVAHSNAGLFFMERIPEHVMILFVERSKVDAITSAKRIHSLKNLNPFYKKRYPNMGDDYFDIYMNVFNNKIAKQPYKNLYVFKYVHMKNTKYWIEKPKRKNFKSKQVRDDK